jgi:uroporphyrinogen decarboxylase
METMTSRERVLTALGRGKPDKVPFFDNVNRRARCMIMGHENFSDMDFAREMRFDALDYYGFTPPFAAETKGGAVVRGLIGDRDDLLKLKLPKIDDGYLSGGREFVDRYGAAALALFFRTRFGPSFIVQSMGLEQFSYALYDDISLIEEFADIFAGWVTRLLEKVKSMGFDFAWFADDIAYKNQLMFNPEIFRSVFLPRIRKIISAWNGKPWVYHSDGNISGVLDDLLLLGMNGLNPIEPDAMDIYVLRKKYRERLCLIGNVDVNMLCSGTVEEVRDEVKRLIGTIGADGAFVIASSNSLTWYCKRENVFAMRDAVDSYR